MYCTRRKCTPARARQLHPHGPDHWLRCHSLRSHSTAMMSIGHCPPLAGQKSVITNTRHCWTGSKRCAESSSRRWADGPMAPMPTKKSEDGDGDGGFGPTLGPMFGLLGLISLVPQTKGRFWAESDCVAGSMVYERRRSPQSLFPVIMNMEQGPPGPD